MKVETIYNELKEIFGKNGNEFNIFKYTKLMERMEQEIRDNTCLKVTSKTRNSAIKKVASKYESRPALTGYAIQELFGETYRVVTDSYHLIAIKQEEMPLKLVATSDELKNLGIDLKEYCDKHGRDSVLNFVYPNIKNVFPSNFRDCEKVEIDVNDVLSFDKIHNYDKNRSDEDLYKVRDNYYVNPRLLSNILKVLGNDVECYICGDNRPMILVNKENELGLVLPIKKY